MNLIDQLISDFGKTMTVVTVSLFKLCCISLGALIGMAIPRNWKQYLIPVCSLIFLVTYIPLMLNLLRSYQEKRR
ncbi:MAG: hypothetical protein R3Y07_00630 [Eubacteriales bacterium]